MPGKPLLPAEGGEIRRGRDGGGPVADAKDEDEDASPLLLLTTTRGDESPLGGGNVEVLLLLLLPLFLLLLLAPRGKGNGGVGVFLRPAAVAKALELAKLEGGLVVGGRALGGGGRLVADPAPKLLAAVEEEEVRPIPDEAEED